MLPYYFIGRYLTDVLSLYQLIQDYPQANVLRGRRRRVLQFMIYSGCFDLYLTDSLTYQYYHPYTMNYTTINESDADYRVGYIGVRVISEFSVTCC